MHEKGSRESQTLVDDGTGKVEIWKIEDFEPVPLEKALYGQFFGGDSYVILYTYLANNKEAYIIYFWQGQVRLVISLFLFSSSEQNISLINKLKLYFYLWEPIIWV